MAHYIATDSDLNLVHGVGNSPEAAIADARNASGDTEAEYVTLEVSHRFVERVLKSGGGPDLCWTALDTVGTPIRNLRSNYDRCTAVLDVDLDNEEIEALQVSAGEAGDTELVETCQRAIYGDGRIGDHPDYAAREIVRDILDTAAAEMAEG
jgi:hypothetical protein